MNSELKINTVSLEQALLSRVSSGEAQRWLEKYALPFHELMAYYKCAMMKVETKFRIFDTVFSVGNDCNHIESIHTRIKSPLGIVDKICRRGEHLTISSIEENLHDVAGVRIICSFVSDIYMLRDAFLKQDDIRLIEEKDYIAKPKPNGYRSLHLIIETPIFLQTEKKMVKVEVQLRTLAMDTWASLEHKIRYKKTNPLVTQQIDSELQSCASICSDLDQRLEAINELTQCPKLHPMTT